MLSSTTAAIPLFVVTAACCCLAAPSPLAAQDMASHRAGYDVNMLDHGKPGPNSVGTYAYEIKATCDGGYAINQLLRLELDRGRASVVTEQQSQMTESRDGRKLTFEHRNMIGGKQAGTMKGDATLDSEGGSGQARFSEPAGQSIALPAGTMFPIAIARATVRHAKAGDSGFDALFFYGEKVKPPQAVNVLLGKVPKRLADIAPAKGAEALKGHDRIFYRGGFFEAEAKAKGEQAAFEMSSLMLDNGIELWGTHEEGDGGGIEYHITRLEILPAPTCK